MLPRELRVEQFSAYPPQAKALVTENLVILRELPLSFLPGLLREVIEYDYKFPAERNALEKEIRNLAGLSYDERAKWLHAFANIALSPELEQLDWVNFPAQFVEQLSTHLWTTHQLDAFRVAATDYADLLHKGVPAEKPKLPRLGITVIGQGVESYDKPLFRKLRPQGAYFSRVIPDNGLRILLDAVASRAKVHSALYAHWYIDGGDPVEHDPAVTCVAYGALEPVRAAVLRNMHEQIAKPGMGPEMLRTIMAGWRPADLGLKGNDPVLNRFQVKLLAEGSGTQIFSTSFTQWAAREALRRAEPATLLVRFAPRQRQRPMNELLMPGAERAELDPEGALIDADMAAYYNWLNQQRLPGAGQASFLAWFEGHGPAVAIGPSVPRGTESNEPLDMKKLLSWIM